MILCTPSFDVGFDNQCIVSVWVRTGFDNQTVNSSFSIPHKPCVGEGAGVRLWAKAYIDVEVAKGLCFVLRYLLHNVQRPAGSWLLKLRQWLWDRLALACNAVQHTRLSF